MSAHLSATVILTQIAIEVFNLCLYYSAALPYANTLDRNFLRPNMKKNNLFLRLTLVLLVLLAALSFQPQDANAGTCPWGTYCNNIINYSVSCNPGSCDYDPDIHTCEVVWFTCRDEQTGDIYGATSWNCNNYCIEYDY